MYAYVCVFSTTLNWRVCNFSFRNLKFKKKWSRRPTSSSQARLNHLIFIFENFQFFFLNKSKQTLASNVHFAIESKKPIKLSKSISPQRTQSYGINFHSCVLDRSYMQTLSWNGWYVKTDTRTHIRKPGVFFFFWQYEKIFSKFTIVCVNGFKCFDRLFRSRALSIVIWSLFHLIHTIVIEYSSHTFTLCHYYTTVYMNPLIYTYIYYHYCWNSQKPTK